jgi:integrase
MPTLNKRTLKALKPREWAVEDVGQGQPQLRAKGSPSGIPRFYLRHTTSDGRQDDLPIGAFDDLDAARAIARQLIARYHAGTKDLRAALDAEREARERAEREAREAEAEEAARRTGTLGRLLALYVEDLRRAAKPSASRVEAMVGRHVLGKPVAALPAVNVRLEDLTALIHELVAEDKLRTAAMVRSILKAAYRLAIKAPGDPSASADLRALRIESDPTAGLRTVRGAIRARERALSVAELRAYVQALEAEAEPARSLLLAHLWLGGQRVEQLARATVEDWDREAGTLTLLDRKGRREQPRRHVLPVIEPAAEALARLHGGLGPWLLTFDGGATPCPYDGLAHRLAKVVARMRRAGAIEADFSLGDLRRTVETRLAALGVPAEVRARLQSHGLAGVQERHYVRHDYLPEVREALEALHRLATGSGTVVRLPSRRRRDG